MSLNYCMEDDEVIYFMPEEVDHHSVKNIAAELDGLIDSGIARKIVFDMTNTRFMDSSGIGLILGRQRIMESFGGGVAVKNPSPSVRRIIQVAGLSRLIISGKNTEDKK